MKNWNRKDKHYVTDTEDNESPSNGNYTDKELGNINDVMTWLDVHNDTQHPHAWLALCNGKNMVISSYKIKYYFNKNA